MIECKNIFMKYDNEENYINNDISINMDDGLIAIVGESGSGKSTFLHIASGLLKPNSGKILIDGVDIYSMNDSKLSSFINEKIGFVFQNFFLEDTYTVYENVEIPLIISNSKRKREKIEAILKEFGIENKEKAKVNKLSGGEKQRVAIARALVNNPKYVFCDEPTGNLDEKNSRIVFDYLKAISKNRTVIVVTHNLSLADECDKKYSMKNGNLYEI